MAATEDDVRPVCPTQIAEDNYWECKSLTERLQALYEPCGRCFPDDAIDTDRIVMKKWRRTSRQRLHRPDE